MKNSSESWLLIFVILCIVLILTGTIVFFFYYPYYNLQKKLEDNFRKKSKNTDEKSVTKYLQYVNSELAESYLKDYELFYKYIKESRDDIITFVESNRVPFISNMALRYRLRYESFKDNLKPIYFKNRDRDDYIKDIGLFLAYYKNTSDKPPVKGVYNLRNPSEYKKYLVWLWRLGAYITRSLVKEREPVAEKVKRSISDKDTTSNTVDFGPSKHMSKHGHKNNHKPLSTLSTIIEVEESLSNSIELFSNEVNTLITPSYDWFLFASHYPIIMCYKLFIDYKTLGTVDKNYANNIFYFIPKPNYSKKIQRNKSNAAILSMSFIIASIFSNDNYNKVILDFLTSPVFRRDIIINYQVPDEDFQEGLYADGGFIIHKNLVSYNYLLAYLYPTMFYEFVFKFETGNINKIINALNKLRFKDRLINPSLISRYGKFHEVPNSLEEFETNSKALGMKYDFTRSDKLGIEIIESARIVVANYPRWSFQYKINCELAYGEVDTQNNALIKQMSMMKLVMTEETRIDEMLPTSRYPGVLSYGMYIKEAESLSVAKGTKTFVLERVKYLFHVVNKDLVIIASHVKNKEFKISYDEVIIINPSGLCVAYLNIVKDINKDLWLISGTSTFSGTIVYPECIGPRALIDKQAMYYAVPFSVDLPVMELDEEGVIHFDNLFFSIDDNGLYFK